jgi:adiponectin receptor
MRHTTGLLDFTGIIAPLVGTTIASSHFGFKCEPVLQKLYIFAAAVAGAGKY